MLYELVFFPGTLPFADGRGRRIHNTFTQCFYMASSLTQRFSNPQILSHRDTLALHDYVFLTQAFFHAHTHTHTRARALTGRFLNARAFTQR